MDLLNRLSLQTQKKSLLIAAAIFLWMSPVAQAQSYEVLTDGSTLIRNGGQYSLRRGARLYEGDQVIANSGGFTALLDYQAGYLQLRPGSTLLLTLLRRDNQGCVRNLLEFTGQIYLYPAVFRCPSSWLQITNRQTGKTRSFGKIN